MTMAGRATGLALAACVLAGPGRADVVGWDCTETAPLGGGSVRVERYVPAVGPSQGMRIAWLPNDPPSATLADVRLYAILRPPGASGSTRVFEISATETTEAGRGPRWLVARMGEAVAELRFERFSRQSAYARASLTGPVLEAAFAGGAPLEIMVLDRSGAVLSRRTELLENRVAAQDMALRLIAETAPKVADARRLCAAVTVEE